MKQRYCAKKCKLGGGGQNELKFAESPLDSATICVNFADSARILYKSTKYRIFYTPSNHFARCA
ncbi:hypothetical protein [Helicobacter sp. 23-1045]